VAVAAVVRAVVAVVRVAAVVRAVVAVVRVPVVREAGPGRARERVRVQEPARG
jgi:hypothetical protein